MGFIIDIPISLNKIWEHKRKFFSILDKALLSILKKRVVVCANALSRAGVLRFESDRILVESGELGMVMQVS